VADFATLTVRYRLQMAIYPWRRLERTPWQPLRVPLQQARIALVTSAGLYRRELDEPFAQMSGGDPSFRVIPDNVEPGTLVVGQTSHAFDHGPAERDLNLVLPLEPLHALVVAGEVGSAAARHLSFNGSITAPGRLVRRTAPEAAELLRGDGVDVALFVPV